MPGTQRECTFRFISQPTDVNWGGKVHGGMVMKWMDQAAYACAAGWSGRYAVTASVGGMSFLQPVNVGDIVEVRARIVLTGNSSMHVAVEVSCIDVRTQERAYTTRCLMVFVALDEHGNPAAVPRWLPQTPEDENLARFASHMKQVRATLEAEFDATRPS
jgi:acyl-CoA hydrolase